MSCARLSLVLVAALASACGSMSPAAPDSAYKGNWSGTTSHGMALAFTVSADQKITSITVGYSFNGCTGSKTFSGLLVPIAVRQDTGHAGFEFQSGPLDQANFTGVSGTFDSTTSAAGLTAFGNYDGCANGLASWSATRQ